jgi:hypothetical protein
MVYQGKAVIKGRDGLNEYTSYEAPGIKKIVCLTVEKSIQHRWKNGCHCVQAAKFTAIV